MKSWLKSNFVLFIITVAFMGNYTIVYGQKSTTYSNQQWIQYYNTAKLLKKVVLKSDGGYRVKNNFGNPSQYIARMAFAYKLEPHHMQFAVGVAHLGFYAGDSLNRVEWRPYVGLVINNKYPGFKLQHRARIEYRSFKTLGTGDMSWNIRYRYRMFMNIPLLKLSSENKSMALSWNMGDEIFINGGSNVVYNLFNQNRLLLGPALQVNKSLTLSLTYTAEYGSRNSPANYRYSNIIWLGIKHKLDFTQKSKVEDDGSGTGSGKGNGGGKGSGNGSGDEKGVSKEKSK